MSRAGGAAEADASAMGADKTLTAFDFSQIEEMDPSVGAWGRCGRRWRALLVAPWAPTPVPSRRARHGH